jgi:hypothetical protein
MQKVEYRCYRCMIVETRWLVNSAKSTDYITCCKCEGESKRISSELVLAPNNPDLFATQSEMEGP